MKDSLDIFYPEKILNAQKWCIFRKIWKRLPPCNFVAVQFTKQTWSSTTFGCNRMCPNGDRKFSNTLTRQSRITAGSFVFIHPEVRFCQQPRAYQISNLNPQSSISSSFRTISFLYYSLSPSFFLSFASSLQSFPILILFIHKYSPSTKRVFFYRLSKISLHLLLYIYFCSHWR